MRGGQLEAQVQQESVKLSAAVMIEHHEERVGELEQQAKAKQSSMNEALTAQLL